MSTQTVSAAAIHVLGQYNDVGKTLVGAWRTGAHRILGGATSRSSAFLGERDLPLVNEQVKARLLDTQAKVSQFLANRLDVDTTRVIDAMDRVAAGTTNGIQSIADVVARVEAPLGSSMLETLDRIHQPIAKVSVKIADTIASGAKKIESRVASSAAAPEFAEPAKSQAAPRRASRAARNA